MTSSTSPPLPRRRPMELPFPFRERLTFRTTPTPASTSTSPAVLVDLYPFQPRINELDGASPSHGVTLSWVLYIPSPVESEHGQDDEMDRRRGDAGRSRDARRRVPQWLYHFCQAHGLPLVSIDHDYLSSSPSTSTATPAETGTPTTTLHATLDELLLEDHLNWSILSTGPNAEAETGQVGLGDDYALFRLRGGLNLQRTLIVAAGESAEGTVRYFAASASASTASSVEGAEGALDPAAIVFIDPQPPLSGASPPLLQQRKNAEHSSAPRSFPPTLILSSASAPPSSLSANAPSSADYAQSLLSGIRASSPEAAMLDELSQNGGKSQQQQQRAAADPTQRYLLRLLSSLEDLQSLRANSNEQQQQSNSLSAISQSPHSKHQQQTSAELPQTLGLLQAFLLNWLGTAAAGQPGPRPNVGVAKTKLGERPTSVSKSRL